MTDLYDMILPPDIQWVKATSKNGVEYQIGRRSSDGVSGLAMNSTAEPEADSGIHVHWPVQSGTGWVEASDEVKNKAGITRWNLQKLTEPGLAWHYILFFENTKNYDFFFQDETGDWYEVNCFRNGKHWVRYNSEKPTIVYISCR